MILSTVTTDCWRPRQENFHPSVAFQFNEDRESVQKKKSSFTGVGRAKTTSNLYFHQYIYIYIYIYICMYIIYIYTDIYIHISLITIWKLFCFMQNVVYFICDAHLLILWEMIIIFNFVQIVHDHNETIKYYASCFKQEEY